MNFSSVASGLHPNERQQLAVQVLSKQEPISQIAQQEQVSRKFLYQQKALAIEALNTAFEKRDREKEILYYLPITQQGNKLSAKLIKARKKEAKLLNLVADIKILLYWLRIDILSLAGAEWSERMELMDFIIEELQLREDQAHKGIKALRTS